MTVRFLIGDVRELLRELPDESVHCVVTSPPYWGLRDYGTARWEGGEASCGHAPRRGLQGKTGQRADRSFTGSQPMGQVCSRCGARRVDHQLGLEPTLGEHIDAMVRVFREVRRVLRKDGTLWLNYGDCYATSVNGRSAADTKALGEDDRTFCDKPFSTVGPVYVTDPRTPDRRGNHSTLNGSPPPDTPGRIAAGGFIKPKDLCGVPWRLALALQDDGWWLRQDIIWHKPNPMPESIRDRCTKAHEYLFLLAKSERYYFDAEAIAEAASENTHERRSMKMPDGWDTGPGAHGSFHRNGREKGKRHLPGNKTHKGTTAYEEGDARHRTKVGLVEYAERQRKLAEPGSGTKNNSSFDAAMAVMPPKRNKRSVWTVGTEPFSEAHFATFPTALIEPCIKAGSPVGGTVLDPFGGAGTTGLVADRLQRNAILIEINPEYVAMARRRIQGDAPLFVEAAE